MANLSTAWSINEVELLAMKSKGIYIALVALLLSHGVWPATPTLAAHHAATMFDTTKVVEVKGTVKELQWTNPHIWIQIEVQKSPDLREEWSIEGGGPNSLSRQGWRPTTFKPGEVVVLRINPMRDGTNAGLFVGAKFPDGTTLGRWDPQP
jgi:hypothetical protein